MVSVVLKAPVLLARCGASMDGGTDRVAANGSADSSAVRR